MKAIVHERYGPPEVLRLEEIPKPTPLADEVLVRIHAAALNAADWHILRADPLPIRLAYGLWRPRNKVLGADMAGRVETVGRKVRRFRPGDAVFGDLSASGGGAFAEYACGKEVALAPKPANLSFEGAAAAPLAAVTALQALRRKGRIRAGQRVLVNGASGGVGTFAVQIAKAFGAEVTAVCSPRNLELARSIGADRVIDYTREDFTRSRRRYDLIVAANGYHPIASYRRALGPRGVCVTTGGAGAQLAQAIFLGPWISMAGDRKMHPLLARPNREDLLFVKGLLETEQIVPVIDRQYSLGEIPEALRYLGQGRARGKVVITVAATEPSVPLATPGPIGTRTAGMARGRERRRAP